MIELDPPQADIVVLVLLEGEVLPRGLRREAAETRGAQGLQTELVEPLDALDLENRVARHHHQPIVGHVIDLAAAVLPADLEAGIVEGHAGEWQVDLLLLALPAEAAAHGDTRAVQVENRNGLDLDAIAPPQGLRQRDEISDRLQALPDQGGGGGRYGWRSEQHGRDLVGHLCADRAACVLLEVDVPRRTKGQDDHVAALLLELADDVLLPVDVEPPAEGAAPGLSDGERHAPAVAPVTAAGLEHAPQGLGIGGATEPTVRASAGREQAPDDLVLETKKARRLVAGQGADRDRLLATIGATLQLASPDGRYRNRLRHARVAPGALARLEEIENAFATVGGAVHRNDLGSAVDRADPALELAVDGGRRLVGVGSRRAVEDADQRCCRMLALGIDETGARAGETHAPAAPVRDLDASEIGRAALAPHASRHRATVSLDLHIDDCARRRELFALPPDLLGEEALKIGSIER